MVSANILLSLKTTISRVATDNTMAKTSTNHTPRGRGRPRIEEVTPAQRRTFDAIRNYIEEHGESPTLAELGEILDLSPTPVHDSVKQLVRKGYLERERYSRRGIRILRAPVGSTTRSSSLVTLPLLGLVAAGLPVFAEENVLGEALVPAEFVNGECFALKVKGESMKGAGLQDGDTVIVRKQALARSGEIVVASIDGEATLKRLYWENQTVELRPENKRFKVITVTPETDFRIIGKMIAQSSQWI